MSANFGTHLGDRLLGARFDTDEVGDEGQGLFGPGPEDAQRRLELGRLDPGRIVPADADEASDAQDHGLEGI